MLGFQIQGNNSERKVVVFLSVLFSEPPNAPSTPLSLTKPLLGMLLVIIATVRGLQKENWKRNKYYVLSMHMLKRNF